MAQRSPFSVIIPTLWASDKVFTLIKRLQKSPSVGEIIIVDNSGRFKEFFPEGGKKLVPRIQKQNLYVNPSWNLGVLHSLYENVALVNDDVLFNTSIFETVLPYLEDGIIGMDGTNYRKKSFESPPSVQLATGRWYGWGCVIFFKKKHWLPIPNELKIWYGDDWIFSHNPAKKFTLYNFAVQTDMSTSSSDQKFSIIREQDETNYKRCLKKADRDRLP